MRLVTAPSAVRTRGHAATGSRSCGPVAEIAALIDAGLRLDISERGLLADTAAILERADAGDLRGRVVLIPEG